MSRQERNIGHDFTERLFYKAVLELGLNITPAPSIRSPYPVADRFGEIRKTVTQPDFLVRDIPLQREMLVEVTTSSGDLEAKRAQQRVVEAAGVANYIQLTGDQIRALAQTEYLNQRKELLFSFFGWE